MRRRRLRCRLVLPGVVVLALTATRTVLAQGHEQHASHGASSGHLRLQADGSKNPALVSDYHAYRQFIVAASLRDDPAPADRLRHQAFVRRIGLSVKDEDLLNAALRHVLERVDAVANERKTIGATASPVTRLTLKRREEAIFDGANRRIRMFLSKDGWRRLDRFVQKQIKPHTSVFTAESR